MGVPSRLQCYLRPPSQTRLALRPLQATAELFPSWDGPTASMFNVNALSSPPHRGSRERRRRHGRSLASSPTSQAHSISVCRRFVRVHGYRTHCVRHTERVVRATLMDSLRFAFPPSFHSIFLTSVEIRNEPVEAMPGNCDSPRILPSTSILRSNRRDQPPKSTGPVKMPQQIADPTYRQHRFPSAGTHRPVPANNHCATPFAAHHHRTFSARRRTYPASLLDRRGAGRTGVTLLTPFFLRSLCQHCLDTNTHIPPHSIPVVVRLKGPTHTSSSVTPHAETISDRIAQRRETKATHTHTHPSLFALLKRHPNPVGGSLLCYLCADRHHPHHHASCSHLRRLSSEKKKEEPNNTTAPGCDNTIATPTPLQRQAIDANHEVLIQATRFQRPNREP